MTHPPHINTTQNAVWYQVPNSTVCLCLLAVKVLCTNKVSLAWIGPVCSNWCICWGCLLIGSTMQGSEPWLWTHTRTHTLNKMFIVSWLNWRTAPLSQCVYWGCKKRITGWKQILWLSSAAYRISQYISTTSMKCVILRLKTSKSLLLLYLNTRRTPGLKPTFIVAKLCNMVTSLSKPNRKSAVW